MDLQSHYLSNDDPAAQELVKFILDVKQHTNSPYFEEMLALLGMAVEDPSYFKELPLTKCPTNMKILSPANSSYLGYNFMTEALVKIHKKGSSSTHQDIFEVISTNLVFKTEVTQSFRMMTAKIVVDLFSRFQENLGNRFFDLSDSDLMVAWNKLLQFEIEEKKRKVENHIDTRYSWEFKDKGDDGTYPSTE